MPPKYTDPTENAAWEIFLQLVGHGKDVDTAAPDTFDAIERFDRYCDERRRNEKRSAYEVPVKRASLAIEGDVRLTMGEEAITEYKLERTGDALVQFTGQLIAQGSSHSDEGPRSDTWHEVDIYQTRGGKWIGYIWFNGRSDEECTVIVSDSQHHLRDKLLHYGHADSKSYKRALSQALSDDELFIEEIE